MKKLNILIIATIFLMSGSCSSSWHLNRAIKKNPSIITNTVDTLNVIIPGESKLIFAKDSLIVNEPGVYIKVKASGDSLQLFYEFLPDTIIRIQTKTVFNAPKTRQEVRFKAKEERLIIKNNSKLNRIEARQEGRTERTEIKAEANHNLKWYFLIIGILIGLILGVLMKPAKT
jgi:hypothetical protein